MAGSALGLISGGLLGFAANKYREKEQQKQQFKMDELKDYHNDADPSQPGYDPSRIKNSEWRKGVTKTFGDKETADAFLMHADVHAAAYTRHQAEQQKKALDFFHQMLTGGQAQPPAPDAPASDGTPTTPASPSGAPQMASGPGGPPPPMPQPNSAGQGQPAPGAQTPQGQPGASPTTPAPDDFDGQLKNLAAAQASLPSMGLDPEHEKSMDKALGTLIKSVEGKMKKRGGAGANTPFAMWREQNPTGTFAEYEKAAHANDKVAQVNVGFRSFGMDDKGNPVAIESDPHTGKMSTSPLPKGVTPSSMVATTPEGEATQLRQIDTASVALDGLESTLDEALPEKAGFMSASGSMGQKLVGIIHPDKYATYKPAVLTASDAVLRAIANRANKEQFNSAVGSLGDPHATRQSARKAIRWMRNELNKTKAQISKRKGSTSSSETPETITSKSGRKMVRDEKSPSGWSYAE